MAQGMNFEFDCPQFYDFCNGVEDNSFGKNCLGGDSPGFENEFNYKSKNVLKKRLTAWNSKLSTPVNKSPFVNLYRQKNTTDSEKLNEKNKRLSKSVGSVNVIQPCVNNFKNEGLYCPGLNHKKSLSEGDIRLKKKFPVTPRRCPATPMCLKRTQYKGRNKRIKTTEELELEKIAELQSLTLKHLRLNEINMKKLKLKPKQPTVPKLVPVKDEKKEKSAPVKEFHKDLQAVIKRLDSNKNMRFGFSNQATRTNRLGAVSSISDVEQFSSTNALQPSLFGLMNEFKAVADEKDIINELSFKKDPAHSGLFFHVNNSKKAALKPFNFNDRVKDSGPEVLSKSSVNVNKENEIVAKVKFSHSFHASHLKNRNDKENYFCIKTAPKTDAGIKKKSFKF